MDEQASNNAPTVMLSLELDSALNRVLASGDPLNKAVQRSLVQGLAEIMEILGIPGKPVLEITAPSANSSPAILFMRVSVNGQLLRYSDELLRFVHSYVNGSHLDPDATPAKILTWLCELSDDRSEKADLNRERVVDFLSLVSLDIIKRQSSVLLRLSQVHAYIALLPTPTDLEPGLWPPDPTWLLPVLHKVLSLKISIADKQVVAKVLLEGLANRRRQEDVSEDLVEALRPDVIEIQLPQEYLRQLTTDNSKDEPDLFTSLREGLFAELGLWYPKFQFVPVKNLKPNSFAFKINHLTTLPFIGLQSDQCLVNDTSERLKLLDIQASATTNPATGQSGCIIDLSYKDKVEANGLTTWNQMGYLILCFAEILRKNSMCFVHRQVVQDQLKQLKPVFQALVKAVQSNLSVEQITRVLRGLVAEEISIRNLRLSEYTKFILQKLATKSSLKRHRP